MMRDKKAKQFLQSYLAMEKNGEFSEEARSLLETYKIKDTRYFQSSSNSPENLSIPSEMVLVTSGFFKMGLKDGLDDERPEHRVFLDSFFMDKYEVSAKEFSEFLNANQQQTHTFFIKHKYTFFKSTAGIIQLTEEFEFPVKTVSANNSMIIDLRLRF